MNVRRAVPFFLVHDIQASVRFYVEGLGFRMTNQWMPDGTLRWCWLERGDAAVMLQEFGTNDPRRRREFAARGVAAERPFVGNNMWVTGLKDPDGYQLYFENPTDVPEDTVLEDDAS